MTIWHVLGSIESLTAPENALICTHIDLVSVFVADFAELNRDETR
jgi:hypothetical protein